MENRDLDKITTIVPNKETGKAKTRAASLDVIKSSYIAEGLTAEEMCERFALAPEKALEIITEGNLKQLRKNYAKKGIQALQEKQLNQAQRLLEIEAKFKQLRVVQLESQLEDYLAYYARHGSLHKFHPITGEVLLDTDEIPLQLRIPSIIRELEQLKGSLTLSEGMKQLLVSIDEVIDPQGSLEGSEDDGDIIDLNNIDGLFKPSE